MPDQSLQTESRAAPVWRVNPDDASIVQYQRNGRWYDFAQVCNMQAAELEGAARLIAEAPAMLAALEALIEAADVMASGYGRIDGKTPEDEDLHLYEAGHDVILAEAAGVARFVVAKIEAGQ